MRQLFRLFRSRGGTRGYRPARPSPRPSLEALEDRLPLSSCHVSLGAAGQFGAHGWQGTQITNSKVTVTGNEGGCRGGKFTKADTDALSRCGRGDSSDTFTSRAGHEWSATGSRCGRGGSSDTFTPRAGHECSGTFTPKAGHECSGTFTPKAGHECSGTFTPKAGHECPATGSRCGKGSSSGTACPPPSVPPSNTPPASISGRVYVDSNTDGVFDNGDTGIEGVGVTLTGTDSLGNPVLLTATTNASGLFKFTDLPAGTYTIDQPFTGFTPETSNLGTVNGVTNGTVLSGALAQVVLQAGDQGVNYNFANLPPVA